MFAGPLPIWDITTSIMPLLRSDQYNCPALTVNVDIYMQTVPVHIVIGSQYFCFLGDYKAVTEAVYCFCCVTHVTEHALMWEG